MTSSEALAGKLSRPTLILVGLFAVSGFTGLIYESIWTRYLGLMLGHAALAQTLVLAIFMGGMAVGSWWAARRSESWSRPLLIYAAIEAVTGLAALVFHDVFVVALETLHEELIPSLSGPALTAAARWGLAASLILPQSILLGMTFPLISAALIRTAPKAAGSTLSLLYFSNSIGAAGGVLTSGFFLIPWGGLPGTIRIAGVMNLALALLVFKLAPMLQVEAGKGHRNQDREAPVTSGLLPMLLVAALLTGVASFFYEIGWIRMLNLVLGTTTASFELMLSAFLIGLALGGLWVRTRLDDMENPLRFAGYVQVLMGVLAVSTLPLYSASFGLMEKILGVLPRSSEGYALFHFSSHAIAMMVMLPATLMAGMTLPTFTWALFKGGHGERSIGRTYAANTVGAILGVLVAVHVLLPLVGTKFLILAGALIDVVLGLCLLSYGRSPVERRRLVSVAVGAFGILLAVGLFSRVDPLRAASGVYRSGVSSLAEDSEVVFHRDGKTATVDLVKQPSGHLRLLTNGKADAAFAGPDSPPAGDEVTMVLIGALPLSLHPEARVVANIGLGSGLSSHVLLGSRTIERVDSVEIEAAMVEAARGFGGRVARVFDDPRSRIHVEDAKTFFANERRPFDMIVSEPSNPWVSGVAGLFSEEFYAHVKTKLAEDGLLLQWLQLYETNLDLLSSVFKALSLHFEDYAVFHADNANILIVAKQGPIAIQFDAGIFESPELDADLRRVGVLSVEDLAVRYLGSRKVLQPLFDDFPAPPNSDYYPYLGDEAPRARFLKQDAIDLTRLHVSHVPVLEMLGRVGPLPGRPSPTATLNFTPARAARQARLLAAALSTGGDVAPDLLSSALRQTLPTVLAARSAESLEPRRLRAGLIEVSGATAPYLAPGELTPLWDALANFVGVKSAAAGESHWFDLHRAVAARDAARMERLALQILEASEPGTLSGGEAAYVISAGLAGATPRRSAEALTTLTLECSKRLEVLGQLPLSLRLQLVHAAAVLRPGETR